MEGLVWLFLLIIRLIFRFGGAGIFATALPFPTEQLLNVIGPGWTLQVYAAITVMSGHP